MNRQQNKIIKLLEKIVDQNQQIILGMYYNNYKGIGSPYPNWLDPYRSKDWNNIPPYPNTIPCMYCDNDTGIEQNLAMAIPPEGLKCPHCNRVVVHGSPTITCDQLYSTEAISAGQQADFDNRLGG